MSQKRGGQRKNWEKKERRYTGNTERSSCLFKAGCSDALSYPADQLAYLNPSAARGSSASTLLGGTSEGGGFWTSTQESSKRYVFLTVWTATKMIWSSNSKLKGKKFHFFGWREGGQTHLLVFSCAVMLLGAFLWDEESTTMDLLNWNEKQTTSALPVGGVWSQAYLHCKWFL